MLGCYANVRQNLDLGRHVVIRQLAWLDLGAIHRLNAIWHCWLGLGVWSSWRGVLSVMWNFRRVGLRASLRALGVGRGLVGRWLLVAGRGLLGRFEGLVVLLEEGSFLVHIKLNSS